MLVLVPALAACTADPGASGEPDRTEAARVEKHLADVEVRLRAGAVEHLSPDQRRARAETIDWLAEYRSARVYPHNHVLHDERTPIFVDPHGTPCAVGYLLLRSGEDELVEAVVRTDNLVRVPELAGEPRLEAWLEERGLTLEEAAAIQPAYQGEGPVPTGPLEESHYAGATVGLAIVTAAVDVYALSTRPRHDRGPWIEGLTLLTAFGNVAMAFAGRQDDQAPHWARTVNTVGAIGSSVVALDRLMRWSLSRPREGRILAAAPFVERDHDRVRVGLTLRH
jgi:hypothetical protein